jgi:hypothetical protein
MAPQQKRQKNGHVKKPQPKDKEEEQLESLLFGGSDDIWDIAGKEHDLSDEDADEDGEAATTSDGNDDQEDVRKPKRPSCRYTY